MAHSVQELHYLSHTKTLYCTTQSVSPFQVSILSTTGSCTVVACRAFLFHSQFFSWVRKPQGWLCLHNSIMQGGVMIQIIIIILYVLIWPLHFLFLGLGTIYLIILVLDWTDKFFGKFLLPSSSCQHSPEVLRYPRQGLGCSGKEAVQHICHMCQKISGKYWW